ncbi:MAG TPA: ABC transporter substrate-binding protein [Acidimicrobiales bacterium]|nr:ABC transporter substrate-binding protein [Acidimicrobiales bacterium]
MPGTVGTDRRHRWRRRLRLGSGLVSLATAVLAGVALVATPAAQAQTQTRAVAADIQGYVPDAGPDAYQVDSCSQANCGSPDPISVHVGATPDAQGPLASGGSTPGATYHALFHLELSAIPQGATVSSLVVTLTIHNDPTEPQDNVANGTTGPAAAAAAAALVAYPLSMPLTPSFAGCSTSVNCAAPTPDTNGPQVVGLPVKDAQGNVTSFSFDVGPMLPYWQTKGQNTGFAVVPNLATTASENEIWAIAFERELTAVSATYSLPPTSVGATGSGSTTNGPSPSASTPSSFGSGPVGTTVSPVTPPTVAPVPSHPSSLRPMPVRAPVTPSPSGGSGSGLPMWLLVLGISLAASVALLAKPVSTALQGGTGLRAALGKELTLHPSIAGVAGTVLIWSSAWGAYATTHEPTAVGGGSTQAASAGHGPASGVPTYNPGVANTTGTVAGTAGGTSAGGSGVSHTVTTVPAGAAAFAGANTPVAPLDHLYSGSDETVGLTNKSIQLCAHAALTFGPAFNIGASDLNVFWQMVDDPADDPYPHTAGQAGIYNRQVLNPATSPPSPGINIQDDGYQPSKAVQAAQACEGQPGGDFFLLSGIGFDQIPAVRVWAEQNHMLYIHHIATQQGTAGLQYSFTMLPTLETVGRQFGQYYLAHMNGLKIGIIERNSSNWSPGIATFKQTLAAAGEQNNIVADDPVTNNQSEYPQQIADMHTKGAQVVFIWENALAADEIIQQSANQGFNPKWLLYPFNLTLYTLNQSGVDTSQMYGMVPWPAYACPSERPSNYFGGNTTYQEEVLKFEAEYAKRDPNANLCGDGGDLLFGTWEAWRQVAQLLVDCGANCTRDGVAGLMLHGYKQQVGANCPVDFSGGDGYHGGSAEDIYATEPGSTQRIWYNTGFCENNVS